MRNLPSYIKFVLSIKIKIFLHFISAFINCDLCLFIKTRYIINEIIVCRLKIEWQKSINLTQILRKNPYWYMYSEHATKIAASQYIFTVFKSALWKKRKRVKFDNKTSEMFCFGNRASREKDLLTSNFQLKILDFKMTYAKPSFLLHNLRFDIT